jgi:DNA-binding NarL/FixJ family response regulator
MPTPTFPVHIALLDDHPLFRQGMRYILQALPYVESVSEAAELPELQATCRQRLPDVLLLDLQMPNVDGPEAARLLLQEFPDLKIIVLSMFSADKYITQMMKAGARSYLPKDVDQDQLRLTIEEVLTTGFHFTPRISRALIRGVQHPERTRAVYYPRARSTPPHLPRAHGRRHRRAALHQPPHCGGPPPETARKNQRPQLGRASGVRRPARAY